jgi:hypothetical protein
MKKKPEKTQTFWMLKAVEILPIYGVEVLQEAEMKREVESMYEVKI